MSAPLPPRPTYSSLSTAFEWLRKKSMQGNDNATVLFIEMEHLRAGNIEFRKLNASLPATIRGKVSLIDLRSTVENYNGTACEYPGVEG